MECYTCRSIAGEKRISPAPFIYEGTHWLVDHAYPTSHLGWLVIVPRRHVEAPHELSREEFLELADIQYRLTQVMRMDANVQKEYLICISEAENFAHTHFHVISKPKDLPEELKGPRIFARLKVDEQEAIPPDELRAFCKAFTEKLREVS